MSYGEIQLLATGGERVQLRVSVDDQDFNNKSNRRKRNYGVKTLLAGTVQYVCK